MISIQLGRDNTGEYLGEAFIWLPHTQCYVGVFARFAGIDSCYSGYYNPAKYADMESIVMKEYKYSIDLPHPVAKVWAIMQDYDQWPEFAKPMVTGIEVVNAGDDTGNGLVRHVNYRLPFGLRGTSIETVHDVEPGVGYTYTSLKGTVGKIRLDGSGPDETRLHFEEKMKLNWPFSWFEGFIQKFMEKYNRKTMLNMSRWLTEHPDYQC